MKTGYLLRDHAEGTEFFCHQCGRTKPRDQFWWWRGKLQHPCNECRKKYKQKQGRKVFLGKIPGETYLQRCLGPCGRVLPITSFAMTNTHKWRKTQHTQVMCNTCRRRLYTKSARIWREGQDGFIVCDVCHVDRPRHHYVESRHICVFCRMNHVMEQDNKGRLEDSYYEARRKARAARFA